jgi:hypothetical protein
MKTPAARRQDGVAALPSRAVLIEILALAASHVLRRRAYARRPMRGDPFARVYIDPCEPDESPSASALAATGAPALRSTGVFMWGTLRLG